MALARLLATGQHGDMLTRLRASLRQRRDAMAQQIMESFPAGSRLLQAEGGYFQWVILPEGWTVRPAATGHRTGHSLRPGHAVLSAPGGGQCLAAELQLFRSATPARGRGPVRCTAAASHGVQGLP
jgi:DNA-binding transcriptional MocR family regulator